MDSVKKTCTAAELQEALRGGAAVVIDVREPGEFDTERLAGAVNIPLSELQERWREIPTDKTVYLMCRSGQRAGKACEELRRLGYTDLTVVQGGMSECCRLLPVVRGSSRVWALDRQVRFAAGILVVSGILLSRWAAPGWIWLSLFVGGGLVFSAVTDTCGMAMVLARMPWNQRKGGDS